MIEARNGAEALQLARQHQPDLVLLDDSSDINGVELCRRFKADAELKSLFIVLLSSEISTGSTVTGPGCRRGTGYIARPIENQELLARVQALLRIQQTEAALRRAHDELRTSRARERTAELLSQLSALRAMSSRLVEVQEQNAASSRARTAR